MVDEPVQALELSSVDISKVSHIVNSMDEMVHAITVGVKRIFKWLKHSLMRLKQFDWRDIN